jgi:hypothetical protein
MKLLWVHMGMLHLIGITCGDSFDRGNGPSDRLWTPRIRPIRAILCVFFATRPWGSVLESPSSINEIEGVSMLGFENFPHVVQYGGKSE